MHPPFSDKPATLTRLLNEGQTVLRMMQETSNPNLTPPMPTLQQLETMTRLLSEAQTVLRQMHAEESTPDSPRRASPTIMAGWDKIVAVVAKAFAIREADMTSTGRTQTAAHARGVAILLAHKYLGVTLAWCDQRLGKTPGTSLHISKVAQNRIDTEPPFRATVQEIEGFLVDALGFIPTPCARKTPMRRAPFRFGRHDPSRKPTQPQPIND